MSYITPLEGNRSLIRDRDINKSNNWYLNKVAGHNIFFTNYLCMEMEVPSSEKSEILLIRYICSMEVKGHFMSRKISRVDFGMFPSQILAVYQLKFFLVWL